MQGIVCFLLTNRVYGIKIEEISEILDEIPITSLFKVPVFLEGVTNLRGKILAVIDFAKLVNLPVKKNIQDEEKKRKIIVVQTDTGKEAAIIADYIKEVKWIENISFQELPDTIDEQEKKYLINIIKTDEQPIPVIDIKKVLEDEVWGKIA